MFGDFRVDQLTAAGFERRESSFLVLAYEAAVAGNIGCKNGSQSPFDPRPRHQTFPN